MITAPTDKPDRAFSTFDSEIGVLTLVSDGESLTGVFPAGHPGMAELGALRRDTGYFSGVRDQLEAYFRGRLEKFTIPLRPRGTDFQRAVWHELSLVQWGSTIQVEELCRRLGGKNTEWTVNSAVAKNPLSVIVPSHRVVDAPAATPHFPGGAGFNVWLLAHEANIQPWRVASSRNSAVIRISR